VRIRARVDEREQPTPVGANPAIGSGCNPRLPRVGSLIWLDMVKQAVLVLSQKFHRFRFHRSAAFLSQRQERFFLRLINAEIRESTRGHSRNARRYPPASVRCGASLSHSAQGSDWLPPSTTHEGVCFGRTRGATPVPGTQTHLSHPSPAVVTRRMSTVHLSAVKILRTSADGGHLYIRGRGELAGAWRVRRLRLLPFQRSVLLALCLLAAGVFFMVPSLPE